MVKQYERLLKLGTGITMGQEGYGTAFHATTAIDGDDSLVASIVNYAEHTSATESKVSDLENRLGMLKIGAGQPANMAMYMHNAPPTHVTKHVWHATATTVRCVFCTEGANVHSATSTNVSSTSNHCEYSTVRTTAKRQHPAFSTRTAATNAREWATIFQRHEIKQQPVVLFLVRL